MIRERRRRIAALAASFTKWLACVPCALALLAWAEGPFTHSGAPTHGRVVDESTRGSVAGALVLALWTIEGGRRGAQGVYVAREAITDSDGRFHIGEWQLSSLPFDAPIGNTSPTIFVFKRGYALLVKNNPGMRVPDGPGVHDSVWNGQDFPIRRIAFTEEAKAQRKSLFYLLESTFGVLMKKTNCEWTNVPRSLRLLDDESRRIRGLPLSPAPATELMARADCGSLDEFRKGYEAVSCAGDCGAPARYSAAAIRRTVRDAQSRRPIEGAVVVAKWSLENPDLRTGILAISEAVTDSHGEFSIPGWSDLERPAKGYLDLRDPEIFVYKSGYLSWRRSNGAYAFEGDRVELSERDWHWGDIELAKGEDFGNDLRNSYFDAFADPQCRWKAVPRAIATYERLAHVPFPVFGTPRYSPAVPLTPEEEELMRQYEATRLNKPLTPEESAVAKKRGFAKWDLFSAFGVMTRRPECAPWDAFRKVYDEVRNAGS